MNGMNRQARYFGWVLALGLAVGCRVAAGEFAWVSQFGSTELDHAIGMAVEPTGVYVVGRTLGALPGQVSAGGEDAFVRKYTHSGAVVWTEQFGSAGDDVAVSIALDPTGVYVAGQTSGALPGQVSVGGEDVFIRKYTHLGDVVWTEQFGSAEYDGASGIAVDPMGVYVTGWTSGALSGQVSVGGDDAFVRKYTHSGDVVWTDQFGSTENDGVSGIALDRTDVYVAGYTYGALPGQVNVGLSDAFVRKYTHWGDVVWTEQFGSAEYDGASGIAVDPTGVYVTGWTWGALPGQVSAGGDDAFVRKFTHSGDGVWTDQFGSAGPDWALEIAVDPTGVYVTGWIWGALPGQVSAGSDDAFARKYTHFGDVVWTEQFGSAGEDQAYGIAVDPRGVYLAGVTGGALPGQVSAGRSDAFVAKYLDNVPSVLVDLFCDFDGDSLHDPGEEDTTTSVGGEVRFLADFTSTSDVALLVTASLEGLPAGWHEPLAPFVLLSGESLRHTIVVRVPEEAAAAGSYPLTLRAEAARGSATASGRLNVLGVPEIYDLLPPDGITTARTSVTMSWQTSADTTGRVHLKNRETGVETQMDVTPEYSREHRVEFDGLALGALYEWWVESMGRWGGRAVGPSDPRDPGTPIPRRFLVGNGVVFSQREYSFDVERDYNQLVELGIENRSDATRDVVLRLDNPYSDVAIGFVGTGSVEEPAVLRGGETKPIQLGVHLQDADPSRKTPYIFTAELRSTRGGTSVVLDTALVRVTVTTPDVRFAVDEMGAPDPCNLAKTFRVTNAGDTVTDLRVRLSETLAGRVAVAPSITSATVPSGGTLDFKLVPVGPLAQTLTGSVEVSGAGRSESRTVEITLPAGQTFRTVQLDDILLCVESADSGCLNRGRFSIPLEVPSTVKKESIQSATLHLRFTPHSQNASVTYRITVSLNGRDLERLDRPVGDYSFAVPLEALRVSGEQTSVNTVTLTVSGFNAGSYYIASNALLCVCLSEYQCGAYGASDQDAVNCCLGRPGVRATPVGNLTADVTVDPGQVVEGEAATIRATIRTAGVLAEGLVVTARTSDGQRSRGLAEVSPGVYEGSWTPSCSGDVTLEVHVAACPGGVIATKVVRVESGPEQILTVPYYDPEGTAWDWACAMSGLLRYHGYGVKPWTIAAALVAEPSQGLDLREQAADLREPSLKSLLAYLRSGLGMLPGVKKHAATEAASLSCELRGKIQEGHPIWLAYGNGTTGDAEVLLVVGASGDTVIVQELGGAGRLRDPLSEAALTGLLFPTPESVAVAVDLLSVAPVEGTGLSLSVPPRLPGGDSGGLRFVHRAGMEELTFLWDGRMPLGYLLSDPENNPVDSSQWIQPPGVFPPDAATGWSPLLGDELELGVEVANAGAVSRDMKVEATLEHVRSGRRVERVSAVDTIGSGESNGVLEVLGEGNSLRLEPQGNYELRARLVHGGEVVDSLSVPFRVRCSEGVSFVRGDVGRRGLEGKPVPADELVNITDAIAILSWLFLEGGQTELDCAKAADTNDDGVINIADPVRILGFLFLGSPPPPPPYPALGLDPTPDELDCCR